MRHFYKIAYESTDEVTERTYLQRFHAESATRLPLTIKPINQSATFPLYYVSTNDMTRLCCAIHTHSRELQRLIEALPGVAKRQFIFESIIAEMQDTNEVEGVDSTRAELVASARSLERAEKQLCRFEGLARTYFKLIYDDVPEIRTARDIRALYDNLVLAEIKAEEKPDGLIFRKDITHVTKRSGSGKVIHIGIHPEDEIVQALERLFLVMNDKDIPNLIKVAIFHYYFGYVHPFYDGNGRTSRFISSCQIRRELGNYSAITLSRACKLHSVKYAELFEVTNNARNRGELNAFIEGFLDLLNEGHKTVIKDLKEKRLALDAVEARIGAVSILQSKDKATECDVLYSLAQHELFTDDLWITVTDLHGLMSGHQVGSTQRVRQALNFLEANGLVRSMGLKPKKYAVCMDVLMKNS